MVIFPKDRNIHRPPHIFQKETIYFISARTKDRKELLDTDERKRLFTRVINKAAKKYRVDIYAWVILSNHYHLLLKIFNRLDLSKFIKNLHGESAVILNRLDRTSGRKIWVNYWDRCIRSEKDFWARFNYIHHNPVKHNCVKNQEKVSDYQFCSYKQWLNRKGQRWLDSCFERYPIVDFTIEGDID